MSIASDEIAPVRQGLFTVEPPVLLAGRCEACGTLRFPPADVCPACQATGCKPVPLSPTGTVFTFTVVHAAPPGYLGETPYAYGVVELPEGLRVTATLLSDELERISIGDACRFELLTLARGEAPLLSYAYRVEK